MTKKQALRDSILHWLWDNVEKQGDGIGPSSCSLCKIDPRIIGRCSDCICKKYHENGCMGEEIHSDCVDSFESVWNMALVLLSIWYSEYGTADFNLNDTRRK